MAKAALFEHCAISSSCAMIFLTRATVILSVEQSPYLSKHTWECWCASNFFRSRDGIGVVWHPAWSIAGIVWCLMIWWVYSRVCRVGHEAESMSVCYEARWCPGWTLMVQIRSSHSMFNSTVQRTMKCRRIGVYELLTICKACPILSGHLSRHMSMISPMLWTRPALQVRRGQPQDHHSHNVEYPDDILLFLVSKMAMQQQTGRRSKTPSGKN